MKISFSFLIFVLFVSDGFCVAETKNIKISKQIFLKVYTPYSLKLKEQASIRIVVFNYEPGPSITVSGK